MYDLSGILPLTLLQLLKIVEIVEFCSINKGPSKERTRTVDADIKNVKNQFFVFRNYFVDKHQAQLPIHFFSASY